MSGYTTAIMAVGAVISAVGTYASVSAQQDQAAFQAGIARNNQIIAERKSKDAEKRGEEEASLHKQKVAQLKARQTTTMAGQGFDIGFGSNVDLLADTEELGAYDVEVIKNNANREATDLKNQANTHGAQAGAYDAQAASLSPLFSAGSSLLSSAGSVASQWYS